VRLVSGMVSAIAIAAFGFASGALALVVMAPEPQGFVPPVRLAMLEVAPEIGRDLPTDWPNVFGTVPPPAPEAEPEPEPDVVEEPPEENTTYYLTGLVAGGGNDSWAMISENDQGLVVRIGDVLVGGETVTGIDAQGVWIEYEGERQLIPVQKSDLQGLIAITDPVAENRPPALLLDEVIIPLEVFDRAYISSALTSGGRLAAPQGQNARGMDLVWMQRGELFDQMGLRTGDTILSVNGKALQTEDLIADMPDDDLLGGSLQLEILRDGTRQMLKVTLDQG